MSHSDPKKLFIVDLEPLGKRVQIQSDQTIVDAALLAGLDLITSCDGLGICASCKIHLMQGQLSSPTIEEKNKLSDLDLNEGIRLACQVSPHSDVRIYVPPGSLTQGQKLQVEGRQQTVYLSSSISALDLSLTPPSQTDLSDDFERLRQNCLENHQINLSASLPVLQNLPEILRNNQWQVRLVLNRNELVSVLPSKTDYYGLALDIGSTKIAAYWVNLTSGAIIKQTGFMNPQISFGEDVVNRITYANQGEKQLQKLHEVLINTITQHISETCAEFDLQPQQIVDMVVVGNTIIHHLFCGLPVRSMGEAPYVPVVKQALDFPAVQLNLKIANGAKVYLPPNIAGYVGADHTAAISAVRLNEQKQTVCLIDIGTNTEISLIHNQTIQACSCASGPAFEGAHIRDGMRAAPGAIEQVYINQDQISYTTINQKPAVGICGSGILSAAAEMRKNSILDRRGVFQKSHPLVQHNGKETFLPLAAPQQKNQNHTILINRSDIHEVQLAKGAIRSGIEILCKKADIEPQNVDVWLIAGAFGTHLDIQSAIDIGMFPDTPLVRYQQIGNAAGVGAKELLINAERRQQLEEVVKDINYIELTAEPTFSDTYVQALSLEKNEKLDFED
ncbi:MAG: hypothetical protein CL609_02380 [Anaerolineaceae bacterium]|nr:hypothetical protein [Anaerolineaceae bacterium]